MPAISASFRENCEGSEATAPILREVSSGFGSVPSATWLAAAVAAGATVGTGVAAAVQAARTAGTRSVGSRRFDVIRDPPSCGPAPGRHGAPSACLREDTDAVNASQAFAAVSCWDIDVMVGADRSMHDRPDPSRY